MKRDPTRPRLLRNLFLSPDAAGRPLGETVAEYLGLPLGAVLAARVVRRSIDARHGRVRFALQVVVALSQPAANPEADLIEWETDEPLPEPPRASSLHEVAVVGTGPAGLFAAWRLAQAGLRPTVLDRGPDLAERDAAVCALRLQGKLDPEANLHFGLGGAGTYSDGKLFTRLKGPWIRGVLREWVRHGGGSEDELLVDAHPHVGTDRWPIALGSLRAELEHAGCRFLFRTRVTGIRLRQGYVHGLETSAGDLDCKAVLLSPGNSARDLFEHLARTGIALQSKALAVGVRMTHPQELIDRIQFGEVAGHPALGPATYRLSGRFKSRGVYTFCMCPGGVVVPTPTEPAHLAINGMSPSKRDSGEANAAVVVSVGPEDFPGQDALAGVRFQRALEKAAYTAGGGGYRAPAQGLSDFLAGRTGTRAPRCGYQPGIRPADLAVLLPGDVRDALRAGLASFCRRLKGLADPRSCLLGLETRTSSPVRILRDATGMSPNANGLFPAGEGAGYAGGITSSAVDGMKAADHLLQWLARDE